MQPYDYYEIKLLVFDSNFWKQLTVSKKNNLGYIAILETI